MLSGAKAWAFGLTCTVFGLIYASDSRDTVISVIVAVSLGIALGGASLLLSLYVFQKFRWRNGPLTYLTALVVYVSLGLPLIIFVVNLVPRWMR